MTKKMIKKIKKHVTIINIVIFFIATLFFYLNKNKFDTYKTFIEYSFQERLFNAHNTSSSFYSENTTSIFYSDKIKYFLNDLAFNKKFYGITNMELGNQADKISLVIDNNNKKILFTFKTKERKNLPNIIFKNNNEEDVVKKNNELIKNFIKEILNKFHKKLYENLNKEIKFKENHLKDLRDLASNKSFEQVDSIALLKAINIDILNTKNVINELYSFLEQDQELIIVKDYSKKFRRLHLNTNEYVISFLILLFLVNLLIRYSDKILK